MAICISLMFGRIGSITGSNTAAFLLENYCKSAFYLSGSILIGNDYSSMNNFEESRFFCLQITSSILAAGALTFFIPKIHERVSKSGKPK